jgi:hypothetical protein
MAPLIYQSLPMLNTIEKMDKNIFIIDACKKKKKTGLRMRKKIAYKYCTRNNGQRKAKLSVYKRYENNFFVIQKLKIAKKVCFFFEIFYIKKDRKNKATEERQTQNGQEFFQLFTSLIFLTSQISVISANTALPQSINNMLAKNTETK